MGRHEFGCPTITRLLRRTERPLHVEAGEHGRGGGEQGGVEDFPYGGEGLSSHVRGLGVREKLVLPAEHEAI